MPLESKKNKNEEGVIYLAFGYEYIIQALNSIKSLKQIHPELPVTIVTNININNIDKSILLNTQESGNLFDEIIYINDSNDSNRDYKTNIIKYSPYKKTLFLDCDTEIKRNIKIGYNFLDYYDICMPSYPFPPKHMNERWDGDIHIKNIDITFTPYFGSGIIFFKNESKEFFDIWHNSYKSYGYEKDQFACLDAVYNSKNKIFALDLTWDSSDTSQEWHTRIKEEARVYHYSQPPRKKLQILEEEIGEKIVDMNKDSHNRMRSEFRKEYSDKYILYENVKQNYVLKYVWLKLGKPALHKLGVNWSPP